MSQNSTKPLQQLLQRDGVSQAGRKLAALDPDYAPVDERSLKDWLAFAREYAKELQYFSAENGQVKKPPPDWRNFLRDVEKNEDLDLEEIVAFMENPEKFPPEKSAPFNRPHFALFLAFLHLLRHAQDQLNTLTRRHLDFYFQQALGMTKKSGTPDKVNVLVDLAPGVEQYELRAGTLLSAGADSLGQDLFYITDRDIVANRAQVVRLSSVFAEKRVTGIREAREGYDGPKDEAFIGMLKIALGHPLPGDSLPPYYQGDEEGPDYAKLLDLQQLADFVKTELAMNFSDFRTLMQLKHKGDNSEAEWNEINRLLEKTGKKRSGDPNFDLNPTNPNDFHANHQKALEITSEEYKELYDGPTDVENINELYDHRTRGDVRDFIQDELFFEDFDDFISMMQIKIRIDNEWDEINRILEEAGLRKGTLDPADEPPYTFPVKDPHEDGAFEANLNAAVGPLDYTDLPDVENIDGYYTAFSDLESYFFMPAENFSFIMSVAKKTEPTLDEWNRVYEVLADAHKDKVYEANHARLQEKRDEEDFMAMIGLALGEESAQEVLSSLLERLRKYVRSDEDFLFLESIKPESITDSEWDDIYRILEVAQRVRLGEPVAQKEEWLNLYPMEDATAATVALGIEDDEKHPRWKTFGQGQPSVSKDSPPPQEFGWAVSSPLLALSQGARTIALTLGFQAEQFDTNAIRALFPNASDNENADPFPIEKDSGPFRIEISTEKGWIEPDAIKGSTGDYHALSSTPNDGVATFPALRFELAFAENIDALAPLPAEDAQIDISCPVLRITLRQIWQPETGQGETGRYITHYRPFKELVLQRAHLKVGATGLFPLQAQNDDAAVDASKPFEPFGSHPVAGSRFLFGHPELAGKKLDSLDFHLEWMGAPDDLIAHYANYDAITSPFTTRISMVDNRLDLLLIQQALLFSYPFLFSLGLDFETELVAGPVSDKLRQQFTNQGISLSENATLQEQSQEWLITVSDQMTLTIKKENGKLNTYGPLGIKKHQTVSIANVPDAIAAGRPGYLYGRNAETGIAEDLLAWNRYLQWELNAPDFQHEAYPAVAVKKSVELAAAVSNNETIDKPEDYQVNPPYTPKLKKLSLDYTSSTEILMEDYQPGAGLDRMYHLQPFGYCEVQPDAKTKLYAFLPQYDFEGELYIGISETHPPQNLSLLFQMAEGSADPDLDPVPVQWSRLNKDRWVSLDDGDILEDTTRGLINSGIIRFDLKPAQPGALLPAGFYWLRAAIPYNSNSVCDTVAIHAQAVSATFADQNNAPDHLSNPLPAESITDLAKSLPAMTGIRQPYTSFGGKPAEKDSTFYTRISERLRHKQRALSIWDYEHIILEQFPQIYKAKCLPADPANPGRVEVIVIPDIRNKLPFNPFEPKAPADLLADIEAFLASKMPAFARVKVKNARYVPVKVRFGVRFLPGYNEGFYKQRLNEELNRFLSPWAYEDGADIVIGGRIYANVIVNFIDERPYVDYVAKIKLFSSEDGREFLYVPPSNDSGYWVETARPDGVLVAARQHVIDIISETGFEEQKMTGINYMKIELDFIVG